MSAFVNEIIRTLTICVLVRRVSMVIVIFTSRMVAMSAFGICPAGVCRHN